MGRKRNSGNPLLVVIAVVIAAIAAVPKEVWGVLAVVGVVALIGYLFNHFMATTAASVPDDPKPSEKPLGGTRIVQPQSKPQLPPKPNSISSPVTLKASSSERDSDALVTITISESGPDTSYCIPTAPPELVVGKAEWIAPGAEVTVGGLSLPLGMLYVGRGLKGGYGSVDPALIDPSLKIAMHEVDVSLRLTDYWPSYSGIQPEARKAYLQWLAGGRQDPTANIGYVFLFFYGLERRVLLDAPYNPQAKAELPQIAAEIQRLLNIYRDNGSFDGYAQQLLNYMSLEQALQSGSSTPPATTGRFWYELPLEIKVGLGKLAVNKLPVPSEWALVWALSDPNIMRRTPVTRCAEVFAELFKQKYTKTCGEGIRLKVNKTKLQTSYRPASQGLNGYDFTKPIDNLPDVSAVRTPIVTLQQIVNECADELDSYSRYIGRNPEKAGSLEALLQLPVSNWPAALKSELDELKARVGDGLVLMSLGELSGRLKSAGDLSRDKVLGLARALEGLHLGFEPEVLAGAKIPKTDDRIALFSTPPEDSESRNDPNFKAAALTLDLACAAAAADGEFSSHELLHLIRQIDSWSHLSEPRRKRLKARLRLGMEQKSTLVSFKKRLEPLPTDAKRAMGSFLAHLTQADGQVSPDEVKFLERAYKMLGLDSQLVYSDLHAAPDGVTSRVSVPGTAAPVEAPSFSLNTARIAQLQKETEAVTALLAGVFAEETPEETIAEAVATVPESNEASALAGILGLNAEHSAFLRHLLSRLSWTRADLSDIALDMELMLDGTLEHINETMLDAFDVALTEGEDPIEINQELLEKIPV